MKRLWLSATALVTLGVASTALAKEVKFVFDVNSSGPEIYPCDAGLVHQGQAGICHYKGTSQVCSPGNEGRLPDFAIPAQKIFDRTVANACVCTNAQYGTYLKDFMRAKYAKWVGGSAAGIATNNHGGWQSISTPLVLQATLNPALLATNPNPQGPYIYGTPVNNSVAQAVWGNDLPLGATEQNKVIAREFATQLEAVEFNLGSENYGAQYYVDICYRGPQIDYFGNPGSMIGYDFSANAYVGITDLDTDPVGTNLSYRGLAKPIVESKIICERQDQLHREPGGVSGDELDVNHIFENPNWPWWPALAGLTTDGSTGAFASGVFQASSTPGTDGISLFSGVLASPENYGAPRFCKTRFLFTETGGTNVGGGVYERAWQHHNARFVLKMNIEETPVK